MGRVRSRLELRREAEIAEGRDAEENQTDAADADAEESEAPKKKARAPKKAKPRAPRASKSKSKSPARMRMRWGVFNDNMKQIAVFDYPLKKDAEAKAQDMIKNQKGNHFVLAIREAMDKEPA